MLPKLETETAEAGAQMTSWFLDDATDREWQPLVDDQADLFAFGCDFVVVRADNPRMVVIHNPLPGDPTAATWWFSNDGGDTVFAKSKNLLGLMTQKGVLEAMRA